MSARQVSSGNRRIRHIDALDAQLTNLLYEVRLIANLSDVQPPQLLDIDSRGLSALLARIADDLQAVHNAVRKALST